MPTLDSMSFEDLPQDWPTRSLRNHELAADVVDLVVGHRDRLSNSLTLLLCDDLGRMVQPITMTGVTWGCPEPARHRSFDILGDLLRDDPFTVVAGVVVAIGHRQPRVRMSDVEWARTARSRLDRLGLDLFGCYVAHRRGVRRIADDAGLRSVDAS